MKNIKSKLLSTLLLICVATFFFFNNYRIIRISEEKDAQYVNTIINQIKNDFCLISDFNTFQKSELLLISLKQKINNLEFQLSLKPEYKPTLNKLVEYIKITQTEKFNTYELFCDKILPLNKSVTIELNKIEELAKSEVNAFQGDHVYWIISLLIFIAIVLIIIVNYNVKNKKT